MKKNPGLNLGTTVKFKSGKSLDVYLPEREGLSGSPMGGSNAIGPGRGGIGPGTGLKQGTEDMRRAARANSDKFNW